MHTALNYWWKVHSLTRFLAGLVLSNDSAQWGLRKYLQDVSSFKSHTHTRNAVQTHFLQVLYGHEHRQMLLPSSLCWEEGQSIPVETHSLYDCSLGGPSKLQATVKMYAHHTKVCIRAPLTQYVTCHLSFLSGHRTRLRTRSKSTGQRLTVGTTKAQRASSCKK